MRTRSKSLEQNPKTAMKSIKGSSKEEEKSQWIIIGPDKVLSSYSKLESQEDAVFQKLPHPKSGKDALYLFKGKEVMELIRFKESCRSWFIGNTVQKDGSIYMATPIDPIFLALPYLEKVSKTGKSMTLDQILVDKKHPAVDKLERCLTSTNLVNVCECKGGDDITAYKLDTARTLSWLTLKVERLAEYLKTTSLHVGGGSQSANFIRSSKDTDVKHGDYVQYALDLVADYITEDWAKKLKEKLKDVLQTTTLVSAEEKNSVASEPPAKKQKLGERKNDEGVEDYRKLSQGKQEKKPLKMSNALKALAKVDKTGMKSMSSFFSAKPKS